MVLLNTAGHVSAYDVARADTRHVTVLNLMSSI